MPFGGAPIVFWVFAAAGTAAILAVYLATVRRLLVPSRREAQRGQDESDTLHKELNTRAQQEYSAAQDELRLARAAEERGLLTRADLMRLDECELHEHSKRWARRKRNERGRGPGSAILVAGLVVSPTTGHAYGDQELERMPHPTRGNAGYFVSDELWRDTLADALELESRHQQADRLKGAASHFNGAVTALDHAAMLDQGTMARLRGELSEALHQRDDARAARSSLWCSPWTFLVGVCVGAVLAGLGVMAFFSEAAP